ncbi:MAG: hypothetical protein AAF235_10575 [Planctomycetota bacterium]
MLRVDITLFDFVVREGVAPGSMFFSISDARFDVYDVIPTPGSLTVFGTLGLLAARRRR